MRAPKTARFRLPCGAKKMKRGDCVRPRSRKPAEASLCAANIAVKSVRRRNADSRNGHAVKLMPTPPTPYTFSMRLIESHKFNSTSRRAKTSSDCCLSTLSASKARSSAACSYKPRSFPSSRTRVLVEISCQRNRRAFAFACLIVTLKAIRVPSKRGLFPLIPESARRRRVPDCYRRLLR